MCRVEQRGLPGHHMPALYAEETRMLTGHHMQTGHRSLMKYCMRAGFDRYRDIVC
jgi:hypothetical protein